MLESRRILVTLLGLTLAILLVNLLLSVFWGGQIRANATWIFGSSIKETLIGLLFLEGAIIFGVGSFLASGVVELQIIRPSNPAMPFILRKISSQREEHRQKQVSVGLFLMLVGGPLLAMSFIYALTGL